MKMYNACMYCEDEEEEEGEETQEGRKHILLSIDEFSSFSFVLLNGFERVDLAVVVLLLLHDNIEELDVWIWH